MAAADTDGKLARLNELAHRSDGEAAEQAYRVARQQFVHLSDTLRTLAETDAKFEPAGDWDDRYLIARTPRHDRDCAASRAWQTDNKDTLASITEATKHPLASFRFESPTGRLNDAEFHFSSYLNLGRLALVVAAEVFRSNQPALAYEWNEKALCIADHLYQSPVGVHGNVGWLLERTALQQLGLLLAAAPPANSHALCRRLAAQGRNACSAEKRSESERLTCADWIESAYRWAGDRKGFAGDELLMESALSICRWRKDVPPPFASIDALHAAMSRSSATEALRAQDEIFEACAGWDGLPLHRALPAAAALTERIAAIRKHDPLLALAGGMDAGMQCDVTTNRRLAGWTATMRRATAAMAGLWNIRRESGSFPARLGAVAREFGDLDFTDAFSGAPLKYRVAGDAFCIYSVGVNQVDDGGSVINDEAVPPDDLVFWPIDSR